jgi:two-component system sensor histidine kinase BaeS
VRGDTARADSISRHHFLRTLDDVDAMLRRAEVGLNGRTSVAVAEATDRTSEARNAAAIGLVVAVTVTIVVSLLLWRLISRPVRDLETGMAAVADGNFGYRLPVSTERRDEFGRLAVSFQSMTRQLAQLDRLKAEFISIASHELKTPINVVLGYIQLMCEGVYGPVSAKQEEVLRTIDAQARSLSRLVHQLLDISRFEAGGGKLDLRATDLAAFLDELEGTFEVLGMQRGVDFRVERSGTLAREVTWDADRVNEVLGNLLSNAFKFTGRGGTVELLVEGTEHEVHLTVRDTGAGIPPEQLPRIFEKFYQADNQGSAAHGGTGLGLAIAKQIVQAHGGEIGVESTLGIGTTFHILLPVRAGGRLRRRAMTPSSPAGAPA